MQTVTDLYSFKDHFFQFFVLLCTGVCQALVSLSGSQPAAHTPSQPGQDKGRGSGYYRGSRGVLKPLYAPQREAVGGNTADWSASKQEGAQPPPPPLSACMFKGKRGVYGVRWGLKRTVDEKWYKRIWIEGDGEGTVLIWRLVSQNGNEYKLFKVLTIFTAELLFN